MTVEILHQYVEHPETLSEETLPACRELVEEHPCFALGILLYLKNLSLLRDPSFEDELERLAICVPDRRALFRLIQDGEHPFLPLERLEAVSDDADSFSLIDAFLTHRAEEEPPASSLLFQPSASSDYLHWSIMHAAQPDDEAADEPKPQMRHQDLIDSFIRDEEKHRRSVGVEASANGATAEVPESIRQLNSEEQPKSLEDSCLTETLARIYIKQRRYEKALQIIQNLRLKYPEKSSYFADQIRFLEKLIINTKK